MADRDGICRLAGTHLTGTQLSYLAEQWATFLGEAHAVYCKTGNAGSDIVCQRIMRKSFANPSASMSVLAE
jgi:hypothetical protein